MSLKEENQRNHVCRDKFGNGDFYRIEKEKEGEIVATEIRCRCGKLLEVIGEKK